MRIAQIVHRAYQQNQDVFVNEMFKQLLHREASEQDVHEHLLLMASGVTRNQIIIGILNGIEADLLLQQQPDLPLYAVQTTAGRLQYFMAMPSDQFVHHLYAEFLCRAMDEGEFNSQMMHLEQGESRLAMITSFIVSEEWLELMHSDINHIARKILHHFLSTM